jgi:hypothetical protein
VLKAPEEARSGGAPTLPTRVWLAMQLLKQLECVQAGFSHSEIEQEGRSLDRHERALKNSALELLRNYVNGEDSAIGKPFVSTHDGEAAK